MTNGETIEYVDPGTKQTYLIKTRDNDGDIINGVILGFGPLAGRACCIATTDAKPLKPEPTLWRAPGGLVTFGGTGC
jgi:hypothetical protein